MNLTEKIEKFKYIFWNEIKNNKPIRIKVHDEHAGVIFKVIDWEFNVQFNNRNEFKLEKNNIYELEVIFPISNFNTMFLPPYGFTIYKDNSIEIERRIKYFDDVQIKNILKIIKYKKK